jgi:hypothetical protein
MEFKEGDYLVWHAPKKGINLYRFSYFDVKSGDCHIMNITENVDMKVQHNLLRKATDEDLAYHIAKRMTK